MTTLFFLLAVSSTSHNKILCEEFLRVTFLVRVGEFNPSQSIRKKKKRSSGMRDFSEGKKRRFGGQ
jgi:hypothetical protein